VLEVAIDLSCEVKSPSSTKERVETGIFRFLADFQKYEI